MSETVYALKVMLLGDVGVGKTTAINRFVDGRFVTDTRGTVGVDFSLKNVSLGLGKVSVQMQIWDVTGELQFASIIPYYIAGTDGVVLAFDSTVSATLENLESWIGLVKAHLSTTFQIVVISTKNDLISKKIDEASLKEFMTAHSISEYFQTSSKNGDNINRSFQSLGEMIARAKGIEFNAN